MKIREIDHQKSETGPQRRKMGSRLLHCCCICSTVAPWGETWSTYCSDADIDDSVAIPKFCSRFCREKGGPEARNVTDAMKAAAREREWREPIVIYREREMTEREKWQEAVRRQKSRRLSP
jgi:hypothetical protein